MKRIAAIILTLVMMIMITPSLAEEGVSGERTAQDIIEELAVYYGTYDGEAEGKTAELLEELSAADPVQGAKWESIMRLWKTVNMGLEINESILPDGLPDTDELCLIVLGFQLDPDGSMKDELIERLTVAKASAEKYPNALIVCTGGGTAAENPDATEAGEMAKWLIESGVDEQRVIVENQSLTTAQNAIFTWQILTEQYPQVKQLAIISSDYHIATGILLFGAEATLQAEEAGKETMKVVSNAAWHAPSGTLSPMFQAGALIELSGDVETAFEIYYETYDIHELPALDKEEQPEILAIYSCPETQIITDADQTKELADTLIFLYQDYTYVQYVNHGNRYEIYSGGSFEMNFDWKEPGWQFAAPHILTIHVRQLHDANHQQEAAALNYDINLDRVMDYCLYPDNLRTDLKLVAAFMQVDKQKLVKTDGSEEYLPTIWFYYDDGSFQQYAVVDGQNDVLFSCGDYSVTGNTFAEKSVLTIHRTLKYQDGAGLTDYDSLHEYVIGDLGFIRVYSN